MALTSRATTRCTIRSSGPGTPWRVDHDAEPTDEAGAGTVPARAERGPKAVDDNRAALKARSGFLDFSELISIHRRDRDGVTPPLWGAYHVEERLSRPLGIDPMAFVRNYKVQFEVNHLLQMRLFFCRGGLPHLDVSRPDAILDLTQVAAPAAPPPPAAAKAAPRPAPKAGPARAPAPAEAPRPARLAGRSAGASP